jgi:hypothetical protein
LEVFVGVIVENDLPAGAAERKADPQHEDSNHNFHLDIRELQNQANYGCILTLRPSLT